MKKILVLAAALAMALALAGCSPSELSVVSDEEGVHITAKGAADGSATGDIDLQDGQGVCINPAVTKGTVNIKIVDGTGTVVYDDAASGSSSILVPEATGSCDLAVSAKGAEGTVEVLPYDIEAHAESDAALADAAAETVLGEGYVAGVVSGGTYENEWFGLTYTLPTGFEFASAAKMATDNITDAAASGSDTYMDMLAYRSADDGDRVNLSVQRFDEATGGEATVNVDDALSELVGLVQAEGSTVSSSEAGTTVLAGTDRPCVKVGYAKGDESAEIVQVYITKGEWLSMVTAQAGTDEDVAEILDGFSAL